jgi:hypothetical protein
VPNPASRSARYVLIQVLQITIQHRSRLHARCCGYSG